MNISKTLPRPSLLRLELGVASVSLALITNSLFSQEAPPAPLQTYPQYQSLAATQPLAAERLNQLLAPIALYPDALVALILPASTVPSDLVLASRFLAGNGDARQIPNQAWDASVQSLASYPEVVTWMDENLEWTSSLGQAFLVQPVDVMNAIQQLRAQAQAAGNLVNTPQQVVVKEKTIIRIVPAEPEYLYVPQYDPEIVYVQPYSQDYGPLITFGIGFAVGSWLNFDFDWNRREIYRGDWQPGWNYSRYGSGENNTGNRRANLVNIDQNTARPWQPSSRSRQQLTRQQEYFQANPGNWGNSRADSGNPSVAEEKVAQPIRQVPRPSRANFGSRSAGELNSAASSRQPTSASAQPVAVPTNVVQPTTPPIVAGQQGRPRRNPNNDNDGQNGNKHGRQPENNASQPVPSTVEAPQNPSPGQIGSVPPSSSQKTQRGINSENSASVPQTIQAPIVDQNGRPQPAVDQATPSGKQNQHAHPDPRKQSLPPANPAQPSGAPSKTNFDHKKTDPDRPANPLAQTQPSQPMPGKSHETQMPPAQANQPQQQPPQPAPQKQPSKRKEQKAAPTPNQVQATPAAPAADAQITPAAEKSDKKKGENK